jgi:hypothetical protein
MIVVFSEFAKIIQRLTQSLFWINMDPVAHPGPLSSLFCPTSSDPIPPLLFSYSNNPGYCWKKAPWSFPPNNTHTFTHATSTALFVVSLTVDLDSHLLSCIYITNDLISSNCTFNLNTFVGDRIAVLSSSLDTVFVSLVGPVNTPVAIYALSLASEAWKHVFDIGTLFIFLVVVLWFFNTKKKKKKKKQTKKQTNTKKKTVEDACISQDMRRQDFAGSQAPLQPSRNGLLLLFVCPFPNQLQVVSNVSLFAFDTVAQVWIVLGR